ncbi:Methyltransferase type 11 domain-containing protein [Gammaproteobacteria bacterium]
MEMPTYQQGLSRQTPILLNRDYKRPKVEKMLAILADAGVIGPARDLVVDIGCSGGLFITALAPYFTRAIGVDIDRHALTVADQAPNLTYLLADSQRLPLPDACTDLVICNHVYEHVPDAAILFQEIHRVLRPGGVCYLGAASRLTPMEPHYHLPFLSWLPKSLAHLYMRLTGKGEYYYENLRSYWGIRRLIGAFEVKDYTLRVLEDPDRFRARDLVPQEGLWSRVPLAVWRLLYPLLPSYLFILRRPLS